MNKGKAKIERLKKLYEKNSNQIHDEYFAFLRFESISSEPENRQPMMDCATWLKQYLRESQFEAEFWEGPGYPVVFASNMSAGPDKPSVIIYGHYDVQPVDPLELWESPPFAPIIKDGEVFARGAQDNKGQLMYVLAALKALLELDGQLPVNVKLCIDGEEECGSSSLLSILEQNKDKLKADYLLVVDLGVPDENKPSLPLGMRGIMSMELEVVGAKTDLHSGVHGGIVYNPNHALVEILAKLRDSSGKITIPGFYDDLVDIPLEAKEKLQHEFDAELYESTYGAKPTGGEKAYTPIESGTLRPTLEINGLGGGYTGAGQKTVIPARAIAKISCRLVPNQEPDRIRKLLENFMVANAPPGVVVNFPSNNIEGGKAVRSNPVSAVVKAVVKAYEEVSGIACGFHLEGASVPLVSKLEKMAGSESVLMGWGLASDKIHAPNERFGLNRFKKGYLTLARTLEILAED